MATEIERKFLVATDAWRQIPRVSLPIKQGYLAEGAGCIVRVRTKGAKAYLTVKSRNRGMSRAEFEYEVPVADAETMLATLCRQPCLAKTRHVLTHAGKTWEVDEFFGANAGLVVAEIELRTEDEAFARPPWLGAEVTDDIRYANASLAERPMGRGAGG